MKLLVVLAGLVAFCSGNVMPTIPGDNSHYVEGESRYIWMSDAEGIPKLIDLQAPVNKTVLQARNGANNEYWLFTRQNPFSRQIIVHGNPNTIWASNYLGSRPLKVIVHGLYNNGDSPMNPIITAAFLAVKDANVIVVDWHALANSLYPTAVAGVPSVGQHLGNFLIWLIATAGGNWHNVHLVGFSLGAHIVGIAGRTASGKPARVTGLDPAGPGWVKNGNALNTAAGQYVEVIHTEGGILGIFNPIGHANFYPNGGKHPQPNCSWWDSPCSHGHAIDLFASSVLTNHFIGRLCPDIKVAELCTCFGAAFNMGNDIISKRGSGIYALATKKNWPY